MCKEKDCSLHRPKKWRKPNEPHCVADWGHHYSELGDNHCSLLVELPKKRHKNTFSCPQKNPRSSLRVAQHEAIFYEKKYIQGHLDRGPEDGLQPPESALLHSFSTLICLYTGRIWVDIVWTTYRDKQSCYLIISVSLRK